MLISQARGVDEMASRGRQHCVLTVTHAGSQASSGPEVYTCLQLPHTSTARTRQTLPALAGCPAVPLVSHIIDCEHWK